MGPVHVTPVHRAAQGSVLLLQPLMPEGHVAGVTADSSDSRPDVWEQALPRSEPLLGTRLAVHEPGRGPHRPALEEATRRVREAMPAGSAQDVGMVPVRALEPRLS